MIFVGWTIWTICGALALKYVWIYLTHEQYLSRRPALWCSVLWIIALAYTASTSFSKLHLLWYCPITLYSTLALNQFMAFHKNMQTMEWLQKESERTGIPANELLKMEMAKLEMRRTPVEMAGEPTKHGQKIDSGRNNGPY